MRVLEKFLKPFDGPNPCGRSMRHKAEYHRIQQACRTPDLSLPQGVWQAKKQHIQWPEIASMCEEILCSHSKDLQIACWLSEAWLFLKGLEGLNDGLVLMKELNRKFASHLHPQAPQQSEDPWSLYEWIDRTLAKACLRVPLTCPLQDGPLVSLELWLLSQHTEGTSKAQKDPQTYLQKERAKGTFRPFEELKPSIRATSDKFYGDLLFFSQNALTHLEEWNVVLESTLGISCSFAALRQNIGHVKRFSPIPQELKAPPSLPQTLSLNPSRNREGALSPVAGFQSFSRQSSSKKPPSPSVFPQEKKEGGSFSSINDLYVNLEEIFALLMHAQPQSVAPYLLRRALLWKNHTLLEAARNFKTQPQALEMFFSLLEDDPSSPEFPEPANKAPKTTPQHPKTSSKI